MNDNLLLKKDLFRVGDKWIGGRQQWLTEREGQLPWLAQRACGITALANTSLYLSKTKEEYSFLYPYQGIDEISFMQVMEDLMEFVKPTRFGIPSLRMLEKGFMDYAQSMEIDLTPVKHGFLRDEKKTLRWIEEGLERNIPVLLLTWFHTNPELRFHWITVIGIEYEKEPTLITSNWGYIKKYTLNEWLSAFSLYRGMLYFI